MGILLITAAIAAGVYYASVRLYPNARCRKCDGNGKNAGSNRARWGSCSRCGGSGRRLRLGARAATDKRKR